MKNLKICILLLVLSNSVFGGWGDEARDDTLFKKFPQNNFWTLSSGERIGLPLHQYSVKALLLAGTGKLKPVTELLAKHNLHPVSMAGQAIVALYTVDYQEGSLNPYQEFLLLVAASKKPLKKFSSRVFSWHNFARFFTPGGGQSDEMGFFVWKILLNRDLPIKVGREVWGYTKEMADVSLRVRNRDMHVAVNRVGAQPSLLATVRPQFWEWLQTPLWMDFRAITPVTIKQTFPRHIVRGKARYGLVNRDDIVRWNSSTELGKALEAVNFSAKLWQQITKAAVVNCLVDCTEK